MDLLPNPWTEYRLSCEQNRIICPGPELIPRAADSRGIIYQSRVRARHIHINLRTSARLSFAFLSDLTRRSHVAA